MATIYHDRWIDCDDDGIVIRGYFFPWGTKHIPYDTIHSVDRIDMTMAGGRARVWGTANPRYWTNLDPSRPRKRRALVLHVSGPIRPFLTPDDPDAVLTAIREHTDIGPLPAPAAGPRII